MDTEFEYKECDVCSNLDDLSSSMHSNLLKNTIHRGCLGGPGHCSWFEEHKGVRPDSGLTIVVS